MIALATDVMNETELFEKLRQALSRLGELSTGNRMEMLFVADCTVADAEREEALALGRHEVQDRQLHHLARVVALLGAEVLDPDLVRMVHEEDWDGVRRRYRNRMAAMSLDHTEA